MFRNENLVHQWVKEAESIWEDVKVTNLISEKQALRLFDICNAIANLKISDAGKKSFFIKLEKATSNAADETTQSVYQKLVTEFQSACTPLLDDISSYSSPVSNFSILA